MDFLKKQVEVPELLSKQEREKERKSNSSCVKRVVVVREQFSILKQSWSSRAIASKDTDSMTLLPTGGAIYLQPPTIRVS